MKNFHWQCLLAAGVGYGITMFVADSELWAYLIGIVVYFLCSEFVKPLIVGVLTDKKESGLIKTKTDKEQSFIQKAKYNKYALPILFGAILISVLYLAFSFVHELYAEVSVLRRDFYELQSDVYSKHPDLKPNPFDLDLNLDLDLSL